MWHLQWDRVAGRSLQRPLLQKTGICQFVELSRQGKHGTEKRGRLTAQSNRDRHCCPLFGIELRMAGSSAARFPADGNLVAPPDLHPVDAGIDRFSIRRAGQHQRQGHIARTARCVTVIGPILQERELFQIRGALADSFRRRACRLSGLIPKKFGKCRNLSVKHLKARFSDLAKQC